MHAAWPALLEMGVNDRHSRGVLSCAAIVIQKDFLTDTTDVLIGKYLCIIISKGANLDCVPQFLVHKVYVFT